MLTICETISNKCVLLYQIEKKKNELLGRQESQLEKVI